jgi:hypothetical protein
MSGEGGHTSPASQPPSNSSSDAKAVHASSSSSSGSSSGSLLGEDSLPKPGLGNPDPISGLGNSDPRSSLGKPDLRSENSKPDFDSQIPKSTSQIPKSTSQIPKSMSQIQSLAHNFISDPQLPKPNPAGMPGGNSSTASSSSRSSSSSSNSGKRLQELQDVRPASHYANILLTNSSRSMKRRGEAQTAIGGFHAQDLARLVTLDAIAQNNFLDALVDDKGRFFWPKVRRSPMSKATLTDLLVTSELARRTRSRSRSPDRRAGSGSSTPVSMGSPANTDTSRTSSPGSRKSSRISTPGSGGPQ